MDARQRSSDEGPQHSQPLLTKNLIRRKSLFSFAAELLKLRRPIVEDGGGIEIQTHRPHMGKWNRFSSLRGFGDKFSTWGRSHENNNESSSSSPLRGESEPDMNENCMLIGKRRKSLQNILGTISSRRGTGRRKVLFENVWQPSRAENSVSLQQPQGETGNNVPEPVPKIPWILRLQEFKVDSQNPEISATELKFSDDSIARRDSGIGLGSGQKNTPAAAFGQTSDHGGNYISREKMVHFDDVTLKSHRNEESTEDRSDTPNSYLCELIRASETSSVVSEPDKIIRSELTVTEMPKIIDMNQQYLGRAQYLDDRFDNHVSGLNDSTQSGVLKAENLTERIGSAASHNLHSKQPPIFLEESVSHASSLNSACFAEARTSPSQSFLSRMALLENGRLTPPWSGSEEIMDFPFLRSRKERTFPAANSDGCRPKKVILRSSEQFRPEPSVTKKAGHCSCQDINLVSNAENLSSDGELIGSEVVEPAMRNEVETFDGEQRESASRLLDLTERGGAASKERYSDFSIEEFWLSEEDSPDNEAGISTTSQCMLGDFPNPIESLHPTHTLHVDNEESTNASFLYVDVDSQCEQASMKTWADLGKAYFKKYAPGTSELNDDLRSDIAVQNALFFLRRGYRDDDGDISDEILQRLQWQLCSPFSGARKGLKSGGDDNGQVVQRISWRNSSSCSSDVSDMTGGGEYSTGETIHGRLRNLRRSSFSALKDPENENVANHRKKDLFENKLAASTLEFSTASEPNKSGRMLSPLSDSSNKYFLPEVNMRMIGKQAQKSRLAGNKETGFIISSKQRLSAPKEHNAPPPTPVYGPAPSDSRSYSSQWNCADTDSDSNFGTELERFGTDEVHEREVEARFWKDLTLYG